MALQGITPRFGVVFYYLAELLKYKAGKLYALSVYLKNKLTYSTIMDFIFIETSIFSKYRESYLDDETFRLFQIELMRNPLKGNVIPDSGGLRKIRVADQNRHKGKRGGARVIYYYAVSQNEVLLMTIYGKDQQDDLSDAQRKTLKIMLKQILE